MTARELDVYFEGVEAPVGRLASDAFKALSFRYTEEGLDRQARLSLSLPLREQPFEDAIVRAFFDNLLQENEQLSEVRDRFRLDRDDIAGLLHHLGADLAGAISCVPAGETPGKRPGRLDADYDALDPNDIARIMRSLRDRRRMPQGTSDPSPLAGVQAKIAVVDLGEGRLGLPRAGSGAPTTHILKVAGPREHNLAFHEAALLDIARIAIDHPVVDARAISVSGVDGLLVRRFDRDVEGALVKRLHQEDFAQALGLPASMKYEYRGGRFTAREIGVLLAQTDAPLAARLAFVRATVANLALGNTDNHAKNHALLYSPGRPRPVFAPLYDIVPVRLDRGVHHDFAFRIGRAARIEDLSSADFADFLGSIGIARAGARQKRQVANVLERIAARIDGLQGPRFKVLGDMIAHQIEVVARAWELDVPTPERDMFLQGGGAFAWS